jgi:hypothetical protein
MARQVCVIIAFFSLCTLGNCQSGKASDLHISDIEWLVGTWQVEGKSNFEIWDKTSDHQLTGKGVKIEGIDTSTLEFLEIMSRDDSIEFIATVPTQNDGKSIPFKLNALDPGDLLFENPEHDFPARIHYTKVSENRIRIRLYTFDSGAFTQRAQFFMDRL